MEPVESFDYKHHRIDIYQDLDADCGNPRDADNLGVMYCEHRRYELGDMPYEKHVPEIGAIREAVQEIKRRGYNMDRLARYLRLTIGATVVLPLYLFDHSGLAMTTCAAKFAVWDSAGWDWGMVGIICDSARTRELIGATPEQVEGNLTSEVEEYDAYLHGSVYGYTVTHIPTGIQVDSCWGFLVVDEERDMEYIRDEARAAA
jgi:hypothetical protein